jgi:hypothetical protein
MRLSSKRGLRYQGVAPEYSLLKIIGDIKVSTSTSGRNTIKSLFKAVCEHGTKERRACAKLLLVKMEGMLIISY